MPAKVLKGWWLGALALCAAVVPAWGQDPLLRFRQLEGEVSRLQRELDAQARRIDQLERTLRMRSAQTLSPPPPDIVRPQTESSPAWLVSTNWDKVRIGMKDIDVIALLGRPTAVRTDPDGKTHSLMYALELGPNAVLAGNVRLNESGVSEINRPVLR